VTGGKVHIARAGLARMRAGATALTAAAFVTLTGAGQAAQADLPPINQNDHIVTSLLAAAIGDEIRKNCPDIGARLLRAFREARKLERYALDKGYSEDEIEAFLDSPDEKDAMRARRDAYLAANGVKAGDADSYCALGRKEIAEGSLTGTLLRAY